MVVSKGNIFTKIINTVKGESGEQRVRRIRQAMLMLVYNTWVEAVLKKSLYNEVRLELGRETQPESVELPWKMTFQIDNQEPIQVSPGTRILELFYQTNGALLILGEPGSGKTTMLVELAHEVIKHALVDPILPIPVVFNLSSWTPEQKVSDWLVNEIYDIYYIPKKISRGWLEQEKLLLLLDGLDEVKAPFRDECVEAINSYRSNHNSPLAICSRVQEYKALTTQLKLRGEILIQPLTTHQIQLYLESAGTELITIRQKFNSDPELQKFVSTPLMLYILVLAYKNASVEDINKLEITPNISRSLFDAYVKQMLNRRTPKNRFSPDQTKGWLKWLAQRMIEQGRTLFYIENINQNWLMSPRKAAQFKLWRRLLIGLVGGLLSGLISGLVSGLVVGMVDELIAKQIVAQFGTPAIRMVSGLTVGLVFGLVSILDNEVSPDKRLTWTWKSQTLSLIIGLVGGLGGGLVAGPYGLAVGLMVGLAIGLTVSLGPMFGEIDSPGERVIWSQKNLARLMITGFIASLLGLIGLFILKGQIQVFGPIISTAIILIGGSFVGMYCGLVGGLVGGLISRPSSSEIGYRRKPEQGIRTSLINCRIVTLVGGLVVWLGVVLVNMLTGVINGGLVGMILLGMIFGSLFGLFIVLVVGPFVGLKFGGGFLLSHFLLRWFLFQAKKIPWNYTAFLDYAADHLFLRKVGGSYIFIHRTLMEFMAKIDLS